MKKQLWVILALALCLAAGTIYTGVVEPFSQQNGALAQGPTWTLPVSNVVLEAPANVHFWADDLGTIPLATLDIGVNQQYGTTNYTLYVTSDTDFGASFESQGIVSGPVTFSPQAPMLVRGVVTEVVVTFQHNTPGTFDSTIVVTAQ